MATGFATGGTVHVEGLRELQAAFGKMPPILKRELRAELIVVADIVSGLAKSYAVGAGLVDDEAAPPGGGLVDRIKPSIRGGSIGVIDTARRVSAKYPGGYLYPARYEFENGGARAFFKPAAEHAAPAAGRALDKVFDRMVTESGFGGGL